jgi:aminoglycoside phosphotransferase (APT) family kinase protein
MAKLTWEALPASRVAVIEDQVGPVVKAEAIAAGLMPGLAAVVHAERGRYFVKAIAHESPAYGLYAREMAASSALPEAAPAPRLLFADNADGWLVMVFTCLDGRDADLSPGSPDLPGVLSALTAIGSLPALGTAPPVTINVAALQHKATALLASQPSGYPWDMYAAAIDGFDADCLAEDRVVHYDLHPGNLKVTDDGQVLAVDWAFACSGQAWIDAALLVPRLIEAGHSPAGAEALMEALPAWNAAQKADVTALAALWTMFREYKAIHGPPGSRTFRAQAAQAGRSWVSHRMR